MANGKPTAITVIWSGIKYNNFIFLDPDFTSSPVTKTRPKSSDDFRETVFSELKETAKFPQWVDAESLL